MKLIKSYLLRHFYVLASFMSFFGAQKLGAQTMVQTAVPSTYVNSLINGYYEALPSDYNSNPTKKYPLLVFLHGMGEIGNGSASALPMVLRNGPPKLIKEGKFPTAINVNGQSHSFIVISPQMNGTAFNPTLIQSLMDYITNRYRVDLSRIYLTGLSMGGGMTWDYCGSTPGGTKMAAIVNICGNKPAYDGMVGGVAKANLPVWAFHNSGDPTCPVSYTTEWIRKLNAYVPAMNPQARGTIFNASGHDAWTKAYDPNYKENNMNVYQWMLQYTRGGSTPANQVPVVNAGADKTLTLPVNSITLAATASDPDGSISSYAWSKVSGPSQHSFSSTTIPNPTISNLVAGTYTFKLTVTDNKGASASDNINIIVNPATTTPPPTTPPPTSGETKYVKVNLFGGSNAYSNAQWNNWNTSSTLSPAAFKYSDGSSSSIKATLSKQTAVSDNGASYSVTMCPSEVARYTSYATTSRTLTISGLDNGTQYDLELYASRSGATNNRTRFTIGSKQIDILTDYNRTNKASFTSLTPTNGQIVVTLASLSTYNYINGFTLTQKASTTAARTESVESATELAIYPDKVQDRVMLQINREQTGQVNVKVADTKGVVHKSTTLSKSQKGITQNYLSLGDLPAGEYILTVSMSDWTSTQQFIKL